MPKVEATLKENGSKIAPAEFNRILLATKERLFSEEVTDERLVCYEEYYTRWLAAVRKGLKKSAAGFSDGDLKFALLNVRKSTPKK